MTDAIELVDDTRKPGRPTKHSSRKNDDGEGRKTTRIPMSGLARDKLKVNGKDPNYHYRWFRDMADDGSRIREAQMAGYEFCNADNYNVSKASISNSEYAGGHIIRRPAGRSAPNEFLYLMRQPREYYNEDKESRDKLAMSRLMDMKRSKNDTKNPYASNEPDRGELKIGTTLE